MTEYCCAGMIKGRESGIIVADQETALVAVRLASDEAHHGLQPYLILRYCPCCGRKVDGVAPDLAAEAPPPGRMLAFPDHLSR